MKSVDDEKAVNFIQTTHNLKQRRKQRIKKYLYVVSLCVVPAVVWQRRLLLLLLLPLVQCSSQSRYVIKNEIYSVLSLKYHLRSVYYATEKLWDKSETTWSGRQRKITSNRCLYHVTCRIVPINKHCDETNTAQNGRPTTAREEKEDERSQSAKRRCISCVCQCNWDESTSIRRTLTIPIVHN